MSQGYSFEFGQMNISEAKANIKHLAGQLSIYTRMENDCSRENKKIKAGKVELKTNVQDELKKSEQIRKILERINSELKKKILDLDAKTVKPKQEDSVKKSEEMVKGLESANAKLQKKISILEKQIAKEREDFEKERKAFAQKFSDFSRKSFEEKKSIELKCAKLSQQVTDFEKVIIMERDKFEKEKKKVEQKNVGVFKKILDKRKSVEKDFEEERRVFETEIKKLTRKLYELSTTVMKEKNTKSELHKKFDLLPQERNSLSIKITELEEIMFKRSVTPKDQIRPFNLFYDRSVDSSGKSKKSYGKEKLVWRRKGSSDEKKDQKSIVHTPNAKKNNAPKGKSFGKPNLVYTVNQLIKLAQKKINFSYCGANDFVSKNYVNYWYGSYYVSPNRTATNKPGPKYQWVPKARSVL
ncbi:hypothetical protein L6452_36356 [Arctium lappa]|uniref:Uncharacterized protein n=1 Tax=Arctium lappa TaxID=4217 RepID=A0ACB8Y9G3_ARCLA|nr:hypothetical protein L6452_36356 [Arctium lappa]